MRYLVHGEIVDPGYPVPPQQFAEYAESRVIPTLERLVKLEAEGKVLAEGLRLGPGVPHLSSRRRPTTR